MSLEKAIQKMKNLIGNSYVEGFDITETAACDGMTKEDAAMVHRWLGHRKTITLNVSCYESPELCAQRQGHGRETAESKYRETLRQRARAEAMGAVAKEQRMETEDEPRYTADEVAGMLCDLCRADVPRSYMMGGWDEKAMHHSVNGEAVPCLASVWRVKAAQDRQARKGEGGDKERGV